MASFELARAARAYDYRSFFRVLLGRGWFVFEIGYFLLMLVILAVMGAAAGEIVHSLFCLPKLVGWLAMTAAPGAMPNGRTSRRERGCQYEETLVVALSFK